MTQDFIEVTSVTSDGVWITINETEYFCNFDKFPWLKSGDLESVYKVKGQAYRLYWREGGLDVDLKEQDFIELASITRLVQKHEKEK